MDSLFGAQRWAILEILSRKPSSPIQIAEKLGTSVSYVSQQLKLLEAAGIVYKEKTGKAEKGIPRNVYQLQKEFLHLTALIKGFPAKKTLYLNEHHKIILRIWLLENVSQHEILEKFYWVVKSELNEIVAIFIDLANGKNVYVVSDSKKAKKFSDFKELEVTVLFTEDLKKVSQENIYAIYDPKNLLLEKNLKGGDDK